MRLEQSSSPVVLPQCSFELPFALPFAFPFELPFPAKSRCGYNMTCSNQTSAWFYVRFGAFGSTILPFLPLGKGGLRTGCHLAIPEISWNSSAFTDVSCIATFTSFTSFTLVASKWPNLWHPKILLALLVCPGFTKIGATSIKLHDYGYRLYSYRQPSWICFDIQKSEALMFQWVHMSSIEKPSL